MEENQQKTERADKTFSQKFEVAYNKYYKLALIIPILILIASLFYLCSFSVKHGDLINKDITLTGGTSIQVESKADINELQKTLEAKFEEISIRQISNVITGEQVAFIIETSASSEEVIPVLEDYLGIKLTSENSTIEFTGPSLSDSFYNQLKFAILLSFIFMAIVVFLIFRSFAPSMAVIFSAFADIVVSIAIVDLLGIKLSTAGIVSFLMLIGYSVDTDILLTARVLKRREGEINTRIFDAFKTGITMTLTSLAVVIIGLFLTSSFSKVFSQVFTILAIGLVIDIMNTWCTNASFLKWYIGWRKK
ncbi:MAG: protein translocase subunit SecF [Candidatus Pacearchaeota archaeon]